ncbi:MAG TPA: hypothetical protein VN455_07055 [Methanotrichaceae archaeon]|nr:hypothetical protein [Methanotrichaceae archaeon]
MEKKMICKRCGTVNFCDADKVYDENGDWVDCTLPHNFEWRLPAGKITPVVGDPIYISGNGERLSRQQYIVKYNIDPEIAYQMMRNGGIREHMRITNEMNFQGRIGFLASLRRLVSR